MIRLFAIIEATTVSGPAKLLLDFCRESRRLRLQVAVTVATFVRGADKNISNQFIQAAAAQGLQVRCIRERFVFDPRVLGQLHELSTELAPDIIETHGTKSHFLMRLSGAWRACPWIAFHHGYTMDARRTELYNQLDRWSLRAPSAVVTVCKPFRSQLAHRGVPLSRITVVHNGIASDWWEKNTNGDSLVHLEMPSRKAGERIVLAVGRLSKEKGYIDLVSAMHRLQLHSQTPVRLLILGEGPERAKLERAICALGLQERVQLLGHVLSVHPYFRIADAMVISSLTEGEPVALLEAMAAGVPVVATAVGGIADMVVHRKTGLLVPPRNPAALALAIIEVLQDETLAQAMAQAGLRDVELRSAETRARVLAQLYFRLQGKPLADEVGPQPGG